MAWCKECKSEYNAGITMCYKCGALLVDHLKEETVAENEMLEPEIKPYEKEVFLVNVMSVVELTYITSMLDENEIGYRISEVSSGNYLSVVQGKSFFGKNINVGEFSFEKAMEIVESYQAEIEMEDELDIPKEQMISTKGKIFMGGFLIFVAVIIILI